MYDFARYAREVLDAVAFEPSYERDDEQIFAASLASVRGLVKAWSGLHNTAGLPLDVEAGFIERMTPNAFADIYGERHFIVMHQALMATIVELCLYLFAQANQFPNVGNATDEISPSYAGDDAPGLYLLRMTLGGGHVDPQRDHPRVPRDAERHIAAVYMSILLARFVWLHELAHCANGHVGFLKSQFGEGLFNEVAEPIGLVGMKSTSERERLRAQRHALEFDADRTALEWLITVQLEEHENVPGLLAYDGITRLHMALLGAYLMTWLFDEYQSFMDARHGLTHPAPHQRLHNLAASLRAFAPEMMPIEADVRAAFDRLSGRLPNLIPLGAIVPAHQSDLPDDLTQWRFT